MSVWKAKRRLFLGAGVGVLLFAALVGATAYSMVQRPHSLFQHVYLIVLENKGYARIVGNPEAPYLNSLIAGYGLATNYTAVTHPSQPNYFTMLSGATLVRGDDNHDVTAPSLLDQLEEHGMTWHVYAQDFPGNCYLGAFEGGGGVDLVGPGGEYARHHNPAISYISINRNPRRCANITSLASFDPQAANFEMIIPNNTNNMHSGTVAQGDAFLEAFVPRILASPTFRDSVLFITWDEGITDEGGGGRVPMIVVRSGMKPGLRSPATHTHRGLLRTMEDGFGLPCLAGACNATGMTELLGPLTPNG